MVTVIGSTECKFRWVRVLFRNEGRNPKVRATFMVTKSGEGTAVVERATRSARGEKQLWWGKAKMCMRRRGSLNRIGNTTLGGPQ